MIHRFFPATLARFGRLVAACAFVLLLPGGSLVAQDATAALQGRVRGPQGDAMEGVRVLVRQNLDAPFNRAGQTDELGYYRIERLAAGDWYVEVQRLGFEPYRQRLSLRPGSMTTLEIELTVQAIEMEGLTVNALARSQEEIAFVETSGLTVRAIDGEQLKNIPGFIEADPLRAAEVLPGVITTSDFSAAFNVRGGSADQNLILIDGIPIFNPSHLGGIVSVFNSDMVQRAELLSGGFPAEYGGRVSSVLDVRSDPGDGDELTFDGAVSLLTSRLTVGGGMSEGALGALGLTDAKWRVAGRRSYFDVIFAPFFDVPYALDDAQGIFEAWTRDGDRISITAYTGGDQLDLSSTGSDFPLRIDWGWGNDVIGAGWTKLLGSGGAVDLRASYSRFSTGLLFPDFNDTDFRSRISETSFSADWESRPMDGAVLKVGAQAKQLDYSNSFFSGGTEFAGGLGDGWGLGTYGQLQFRPGQDWIVDAGVRLDGWYPTDWDNTVEIAPRVSIKRFFADQTWAVKAAVGRFTQFLHSIRDEELPLGLDIWVLAGQQAPAVVSDQGQLGVEFSPGNGLFFSVEGYLRDFDGVVTVNAAENPNDPTDDYLPGTGTSYGIDAFAQKRSGETTGWVSLSWLKATREFPDFNSGLDPIPMVEYPPVFDRRWDVDIVVNRRIGRTMEAGFRWNFGTGLPFTQPAGAFPFLSPRISDGRLEWNLEGDDPDDDAGPGSREIGILLGARNGSRYPVRHRLDASIRKHYQRTWGSFTPYLSVLNVYNRKNVLFYFFEYDEAPPVRSGVSMFPLIPTFGVEFTF